MNEQILEMKKKANDIRILIEKCNQLMNYIESSELIKKRVKKSVDEKPKSVEENPSYLNEE